MKYTKVKLELITDYDMVLFLDRAMYGGVSFVGKYVCVCGGVCLFFVLQVTSMLKQISSIPSFTIAINQSPVF